MHTPAEVLYLVHEFDKENINSLSGKLSRDQYVWLHRLSLRLNFFPG